MQRVVLNDVDPASLEDAVGAARYAMGVQYLRQRAVVHTWWDSSESALHGMVRERTGELYRTSAYFLPGPGLPLGVEHGHCRGGPWSTPGGIPRRAHFMGWCAREPVNFTGRQRTSCRPTGCRWSSSRAIAAALPGSTASTVWR